MAGPETTSSIKPKGRGLRMVALVVFIAMALLSVSTMTLKVFQKQQELQTASSDSVIWTLSQLEVEYLKFSLAIGDAVAQPDDPARLRELRQKFDIFYSRVDTVSNLAGLRNYEGGEGTRAIFAGIRKELDAAIIYIDANDIGLQAGLPQLSAANDRIAADVRKASLENLQNFVAVSNQARESVLSTMQLLGAMTIGMMIALIVVIFILFRMSSINERIALEQRLLAARMKTIVNTSLDAVLVVDADGIIEEFNGAAEKVFGYTQQEATGQNLADLIIPDEYKRAHDIGMQRMRERGEKRLVGRGRIEIEALRKNGAVFPVELSIEQVETNEGILFVSFVRDISDRKRAERDLVEARDRALAGERTKSRFLAIMSHEMRTPLNGLLGMLDLMRQSKTDDKQNFYIENMEFSGRVLMDLINNVLDLTKLDTAVDVLNNSSFDPARLVQEVLASQMALARKNENYLNYEWVGDPVSGVLSDRARLRQILLNLVNNAIKFTRNGEITVEAEILEPLTVDGRYELELRVLDTGCGIPETDLDRVFDDFETVDNNYDRINEGSGLGLGIVRRLVRMMGGQIGVESELDEGSLFWVRLPVVITQQKDDNEMFPALATLPRGANLLMVEDNEINRRVLREMLESQGHIVAEAHDGMQAVEKTSLERFDAILMDISMPGMDGITATRHIRAGEGPNNMTPIIAVTAHALPEEVSTFVDAGMNAVLNKPVIRGDLFRVLNQWIGEDDMDEDDDDGLDEGYEENVIRSLARDLPAEDLAGLVGRFLTETDSVIAALADMPHDEDHRVEITSMVHKTAGSAGSFGLSDFHHDLAAAQTGLKTDPDYDISASMAQLGQSWQIARKEVIATLDDLKIKIDA
ncbi:hybrid sensor histidine kinase/response regulator [Donghicola mangrovi]|uniref:histidine kinase n=1 Tax=Donghicola mangrovi TaxID=2729614 RepID=A0A850QA01_9RHOB|nr:PAS domain-containing hybrid sensor histidine kinase/response regulator [Donghicola mangrovi]NVO25092.1 PAS domain S-box protein [Donghicola mangrovi]